MGPNPVMVGLPAMSMPNIHVPGGQSRLQSVMFWVVSFTMLPPTAAVTVAGDAIDEQQQRNIEVTK